MLVKIRDQEGYMSELSRDEPVAIVEYHSPILICSMRFLSSDVSNGK